MKYYLSAKATFSSTHQASEPSRCLLQHGHAFEVMAMVVHEMLDDGVPRGAKGLEDALRTLCVEFDGRPIEKMAPGVNQSLPALAAYFAERLIARFPYLAMITVKDEHGLCGRVVLET
jgi:6-pyruvoyl-tetrahydropterin synthase